MTEPRWTRRRLLTAAGITAASALVPSAGWGRRSALAATHDDLVILPRTAWGSGHPPVGPLEIEAPEHVRFLLVHHTATPNDYAPGAVPGILQSIYRFHVGPKGWPDVAYNFFVDRYGTVWEGREGSVTAPVRGSATGGSQGYALLCTFIGDHTEVAPTAAALDAMVRLLAVLAGRYGIDPRPGAQATFVSRGSNRWPAGQVVTTTTIAGHRDMSYTACPGDAAYGLLHDTIPARVTAILAAAAEPHGTEAEPAEPADVAQAPVKEGLLEQSPAKTPPELPIEDHRQPAGSSSSNGLDVVVGDPAEPGRRQLRPVERGGLAAAAASLGALGVAVAKARTSARARGSHDGRRSSDIPQRSRPSDTESHSA